jgi:hypothetical protein
LDCLGLGAEVGRIQELFQRRANTPRAVRRHAERESRKSCERGRRSCSLPLAGLLPRPGSTPDCRLINISPRSGALIGEARTDTGINKSGTQMRREIHRPTK